MKYAELTREHLELSPELSRSRHAKSFEERLRASIEEIGLAEPLKVARCANGTYLVVDGAMRLKAIDAIREKDPSRFKTIASYVVDFDRRFELRFQTDIYQDLLPSQLAALMEHLHEVENVRKVDIGRYVGVSGPTVRNYTGLWRMLQRGGLFAKLVELMDVGVLPASNPYAWLRLTDLGIRVALEDHFSDGELAEAWIADRVARARRGDVAPIPRKIVDEVTDNLSSVCYREDEEVRSLKRDLGLRRRTQSQPPAKVVAETKVAVRHLERVAEKTHEPVLRTSAKALARYLA
jgi:hypothetical protein